jgi:DNA-binding transcriptional LysR family regulator
MPTPLTLEALEVIDAIDRKGSFAAAAASLYRVPSKVTYTINKLEAEIGVRLFKREGRRSLLTPAGLHLLQNGRELLDDARRLVEKTRQVHSGWEPAINIVIDSILETDVLLDHLQEFCRLHPDIEINIFEEVLGGSWEAVIEDRAELVIGAPEVPSNCPGVDYIELEKTRWVFAVSNDHPLVDCTMPLTGEEIARYRSIVVRDSSRNMPALSRRVFEQQSTTKVSTIQQKVDAQQSGHGVGFLPEFRIREQLRSGELVVLPLEDPPADSPLYLAWKKNNKGKALRWFIERIRESGIRRERIE